MLLQSSQEPYVPCLFTREPLGRQENPSPDQDMASCPLGVESEAGLTWFILAKST